MLSLCLGLSLHLLTDADLNGIHPCVRYEDSSFEAGAFVNSERGLSLYGSNHFGNLQVGLATGYTGYSVVPFVKYNYKINDNTRLFVMPGAAYGNFIVVVGVELNTF